MLDFVDANGAAGGLSPTLAMRYLHGPAVDQILAQEDVTKSPSADDRVVWMLTDQLGSVRDLLDNTGLGVAHYQYDAFGNFVNLPSAPITRYLWTGRELDIDTGLQYNRNRWYDSTLGRWISEDPIGRINQQRDAIPNLQLLVGGNAHAENEYLTHTAYADGPNPHEYGSNNPLTFVDPYGTDVVVSPPAGPWGHRAIQVEVRDSSGRVVGILSADFAFAGNPSYCELLFGAPGQLVLYFSPGGQLGRGDRFGTTPAQDQAVLDWILQQAGANQARSGTHRTNRNYSALGYNCQTFVWDAARQGGIVQPIPRNPCGPENFH